MAIKNARLNCGMTQAELAKQMNVTQGAVSQWEKEETTPRPSLLPKLASVLNCTIDDLLRPASECASVEQAG